MSFRLIQVFGNRMNMTLNFSQFVGVRVRLYRVFYELGNKSYETLLNVRLIKGLAPNTGLTKL